MALRQDCKLLPQGEILKKGDLGETE